VDGIGLLTVFSGVKDSYVVLLFVASSCLFGVGGSGCGCFPSWCMVSDALGGLVDCGQAA
jgi:hypothetical protein